jgi:hypothetical protein
MELMELIMACGRGEVQLAQTKGDDLAFVVSQHRRAPDYHGGWGVGGGGCDIERKQSYDTISSANVVSKEKEGIDLPRLRKIEHGSRKN